MSPPVSPVNRHLTGLLSLACLGSGVLVATLDSLDNMWCASLIRTGLVLAALWLALPSKGRAAAWANVSPWWFVGLTALLLILVRRPLVLVPIVALLVVLMAFLPGKRKADKPTRPGADERKQP